MANLKTEAEVRVKKIEAINHIKAAIAAMYEVKDFKYSNNQKLSADGDTETVSMLTTCLNRIETIGFYRGGRY